MRDGHHSGFHDATPDQWRSLVREAQDDGCQVLGLTESRDGLAPDGWGQFRPDGVAGGECSVLWDQDHAGPRLPHDTNRGHLQLTDKTFFTGTGHERPGVVATFQVLTLREGGDLLRLVWHMPASVQRGDEFSTNVRRVLAWKDALAGARREILRLQAELAPDETTASFDANVDLTRPTWRAVINTGLHGTGLRVKAPEEGTHHDRGIDGFATTMRRVRRNDEPVAVRVGRPIAGFDHRRATAALESRPQTPGAG